MSGFTLTPQIKARLIALLGASAGSAFTLEGYQRQSHSAETMVMPHVTVFWKSTDFPREGSGWQAGPFRASITFAVELKIAAPAKADLSVLESSGATASQLMAALSAMEAAAANADDMFDTAAGTLWSILMDPVNSQLSNGGTPLAMANRWVANARKEQPVPRGEYVILSGSLDYTCTGTETITSVVGTPATAGIDIALQETADQTYDGSAGQSGKLDTAQQGAKV